MDKFVSEVYKVIHGIYKFGCGLLPKIIRLPLQATTMRGKFGSEFETQISYNAPMHFRHRQTDTNIVA